MEGRFHFVWALMRRPRVIYVAMCLVAAVLVFGRTYEWDQAMGAFEKALQPKWSPPLPKDGSKRFFLDNDPYYWITFARQMAQTGEWRIRYTYVDNVPYGREVHWSQSVMWLLVAFGYMRHVFTGEPMYQAIEGASIWLNPVLLVAFAALFSWLISRRMGVIAAVFFALTFVTLPSIDWAFHPFRLGHHGLHLAVSLGTVLCLVLGGLGWVAKRRDNVPKSRGPKAGMKLFQPLELLDKAQAQSYFVAAGVFTGLGLWIGATVEFFNIGALAVASVLLAFLMPAHLSDEDTDYLPELWRIWGIVAGVVGMILYLVEYFPAHMELRLEVNGPLYALAVVCVSELMVQLTRWRSGGQRGGVFGWLKIGVLVAGVVLIPVLFAFGPERWHSIRDVQMYRLHRLIQEFFTYHSFNSQTPISSWFFKYYGILPFFILGALLLSGPRRTRLYEWAALWITFFLSVFSMFLTLCVIRWSELHAAMLIWLMIVVGHIAWRNLLRVPQGQRPLGWAALVAGLVTLQALAFEYSKYSDPRGIREGNVVAKELIDAAMKKYLAEGLGAAGHGAQMRVLCDPDEVPALYYFGGISGVTSFYWENLQGVHDATDFFTDRGDSRAREIAKQRGLTHVMVFNDAKLGAEFNYIKTGDANIADAGSTLLARLAPGRVGAPPWIAVDTDLTQIGWRDFSLWTPKGIASLRSQVTIYRLEPTSVGEQNSRNGIISGQR